MEGLPKDVIYSCLCPYLELAELARCAQVSHQWLEMFRANGAFRHIKDRIARVVPSLSPKNNYFLFLKNVHNLSAINDTAIYELVKYTLLSTLAISRDPYYRKDEDKIMVVSFSLHGSHSMFRAVIDTTDLIIIKKIDVICGSSLTHTCSDTRLRDALYKLLFD